MELRMVYGVPHRGATLLDAMKTEAPTLDPLLARIIL